VVIAPAAGADVHCPIQHLWILVPGETRVAL
jgi:hypothetical protein